MYYEFSNEQLKLISQTLSNIGVLLFGALVIPPLFVNTFPNTKSVIIGIIVSFAFWFFSVLFVKDIKL